MAKHKCTIKYTETFIQQFDNILKYFIYKLKNKIAAENFYDEVRDEDCYYQNKVEEKYSDYDDTIKNYDNITLDEATENYYDYGVEYEKNNGSKKHLQNISISKWRNRSIKEHKF